jgi:endonuclease III
MLDRQPDPSVETPPAELEQENAAAEKRSPKRTQAALKILNKIEMREPVPTPVADFNLLQQGLCAHLLRVVDAPTAEACVRALVKGYADWNELRVAQAQEITGFLGRAGRGAQGIAIAQAVKDYLQEVFQRSHGLDLEFLRDDPAASTRFLTQLPVIGLATANYLLWLATQRELPVTGALIRVLDRLGIVTRTGSLKKARSVIEPIVPKGRELEFAMRIGSVASRWCDARKPICWECVLVEDCRHGKKVFKEWRDLQARLAVQRAREEAKAEQLRKKDEERRQRDEERAKRREEADRRKRDRELDRQRKIEAREREREQKRLQREKAKEDARRKKEQERLRSAQERAKREEAARKAKAKKAAAKKQKGKAARKPARKKPTRKKAPQKPRKPAPAPAKARRKDTRRPRAKR